jgi:zinc and cadmium transporter
MFVYLTLSCIAIAGASLAGGLAPLATVLTHTRLQVYLSFAAGAMLGAVFFHMLPEAVESGGSGTLRWTAWGLLCLFFLERFFAFHHHEAPGRPAGGPKRDSPGHSLDHHHSHEHNAIASPRSALNWGAAAIGLAIHTLVGGFALASAVAVDYATGSRGTALGVLIATLVHKPADALTIVSLMVRAGVSRTTAHLVNLGFSLLLPLGVVGFFLGRASIGPGAGSRFSSGALAFSAGTFLCIALSDLLPELHFHEHDRFKLSAALLVGFGLMFVTAVVT